MLVKDKSTDIYENNYHFLIDNIAHLVGEVDLKGTFTYVNPYIYNELGYQIEELIGCSIFDLIHPNDIRKIRKILNKCFNSRESIPEIRLKHKNNQYIWFELKSRRIKKNSEKKIKIIIDLWNITKFKQLGENLQKKEENFNNLSKELETIMDIVPGMIFVKDRNGKIIRVNQCLADLLELSKEEIMGKSSFDLFPKEQAKAFRNDDLEVINSGKPKFNIEEVIEFPSGNFTVITSKVPYYNDNKEIEGIIGIAIDITERKILEQKLKTSEVKYRNLFNNSPNMIALINYKGTLVDVNDGILKFTGYQKEDIVGRNLKDFDNFFARNLPIIKKKFKNILKNRSMDLSELELEDKNKQKTWVNLQASLIEVQNQIFIQVMMKDITERKEAEQMKKTINKLEDSIVASKKAEDELILFKKIFETSSEAIAISNPEGQLIFVNPAHEKLFGHALEEAQKLNYRDYYPPHSIEALNGLVAPLLARGEGWEGELDAFNANGELFPLWEQADSILDDDGNILYAFGIMHNITEHKKFENELENKVKEKTEDLEVTIQKLKEAEGKALKEAERAEKYLELAGVIILALDKNGNIILLNKKGYDVLGYHKEEIYGFNWFDYCIPQNRKKDIQKTFQKLMNGEIESVEFYENPIITKNRIVKIIAWHNTILYNDDGEIIGTLSSGEDITERKMAEQKLRDSEENYKRLVEDAQEGVWVLDKNENTIFVNPRICEMLGYTKEEMMGENLHSFIRDSMEPMIESNRARREKGVKETYELQLLKKDGKIIYTEAKSAPIMDENHNYKGSFAYITDITSRKIAEQELKKSENKYRELYEDAPNAYFSIRRDQTIKDCNKVAETLLGFSKEEILKLKVFDLYTNSKNGVIKAKKLFTKFLKGQRIQDEELQMKRKNGTPIWISLTVKPIKDQSGKIIESRSMVIDISKRKKAEKTIIKREHELNGRVKELRCLYDISTFTQQHNMTIEELFNNVLTIIQQAMQFPEITCVKISCYGQDFKTENFKETNWGLNISVEEYGEISGVIKVYLLETRKSGEGLFLKEEIDLLNGIAKLLGVFLERKSSEEKILKTARELKNLMEAVPIGISMSTLEGKILECNTQAYKIFGYTSKKEFLKVPAVDFYQYPSDRIKYIELLKKGSIKDFVVKFKNKDETTFWGSMTSNIQQSEEKTILINTFQNISDRKKAEIKLLESEQKYRDLIETSAMGLLEIDVKKGGVVYINPRLLEIIGYTKEEIISNGMFIKSVYSNDLTKIEEPIEKDIEFRLISKEGKTLWLSGRTIHQFNDQGELVSLRLWLQDITEVKELEEIKSNLLTRISHELKTPLISIKGFTDLLLSEHKKYLNDQAISFLKRIKEGGDKLKSLIDNFIETTHLDKHLVRLNMSYENIGSLIKKKVKDLEGLIKLRNIEINMKIHDELMNYVDKEKIESVISNLLTNALKFTPNQGRIFIKSTVRKSEMKISISDSGIGLQKEDMIKLFKPFGKIERYGRGWDIISEGVGLGLYLSKEIIDLHNGKIWAKSKGLNKGSTFYILLPIIKSLEPEE